NADYCLLGAFWSSAISRRAGRARRASSTPGSEQQVRQEPRDQAVHDGAEHARPEAHDDEAFHEAPDPPEEQAVDDEDEEPEREKRGGKREEDEQRPDDRVHQA